MILTILLSVVTAIAVGYYTILYLIEGYSESINRRQWARYREDNAGSWAFILSAIYISYMIIFITVIISKPYKTIDVDELQYSIEYRLEIYEELQDENLKNINWQELVKDIQKYNKIVKKAKRVTGNPFVSWWGSKKIAEKPLVKYEGF